MSLNAGQEITNLILPMLPAGVIQGRVFDEDGDPAPNVGVFVFSTAGSGIPSNATTNDLGDYRIAGLSGSEYFVMAQAARAPIEATSNRMNREFMLQRSIPAPRTNAKPRSNARSGPTWQTLRTSQTIEVRSADVDGLQLFPEPPSQIRGHFRMDTNSNQQPDWTQLNIQIDPDDREGLNGSIVGKVSKDGSFNVQVTSGNYHAVVTSNTNVEGWRDFIVKEVVLNGKDVGDSGFSVAGGLTSLEIVASGQGSTIEGNVVDEEGKPVPDTTVVCIPDASRRTRHDIYQQVQTDPQGHFAMRGLNPGEYQVFTLDDPADDITDPDFVSAHEALGQSVRLDPGERKGVVLKLAPESQP